MITALSLVSVALLGATTITHALSLMSAAFDRPQQHALAVSDTDQVGLDLQDELTFEMWVQFRSLPPFDQMTFVSKRLGDFNNERSYFFGYEVPGNIRFTTWTDGSSLGVHGSAAWTPELNHWYHVAVAKSGTEAQIYVDGTPLSSPISGANGQIYDGPASFSVAADILDNVGYFDGLIDDVRVWNVARTAEEIVENMNKELTGTEPGLVGYWRLNGDFADASVNGNDLTPVNGPGFSNDVPFSGAPPMTPVEQANALITAVEGHDLPHHVTRSYLANLKKVPRFIEEEKFDAALNQLIAFVSKVQGHQADGTIEEAVAETLLEPAEVLMLAII